MSEFRYFFAAIGFLTRVPVYKVVSISSDELRSATRYFPLVGVVVGCVAAFVYWLAGHVLPPDIALIISMVVAIFMTGALHEDGLADTADGLGGGWNKEQMLEIMRDSRIGSYGAIALMIMLFSRFETLVNMPLALFTGALVAGHAISRLAMVFVIYTQQYVRNDGKAAAVAGGLSLGEIAVASILGLLPLIILPWQAAIAGVGAVFLVAFWFAHKLKKLLGGYTGDCLGAMQQLTELAFYLGILIWVGY